MTAYDEEKIADLLHALPPAPEAWVQAAQQLPLERRGLDEIVERARADAEYRSQVVADLEAALKAAGVEPAPATVAMLRARLG